MVTLNNYPNYSQLAAKINGPNDCVPTSIKDGVKYLTGHEIDVDQMMTSIYGPNYHGFTSASAFINYVASLGVKLFPIDGDNTYLVNVLHQQIQMLHPCLLTEPDPYAPLHPEWSHVLSVYKEAPGSLTARDPYSTVDVTHSDATWVRLLEFREVWSMERIEDEMMQINISMPEVQHYFTETDPHHWKCKQNGYTVQYGILDAYKKYGNGLLCGLSYLGLPVSNEIVMGKNEVRQHFERGVLAYDPTHAIDSPPKWGPVYPMHLYSGPGQDPRVLNKIA